MVAVSSPVTIIGHIMPCRTGANGCLTLSNWWQAAAASGCVPPVGSHWSVQCSALAPGRAVTSMVTETLAAAALAVADAVADAVAGAVAPADAVELADPPELAVLAVLPQAASAIAHSAAGRTYEAQERARRKERLMVVLTHPARGRFRGAAAIAARPTLRAARPSRPPDPPCLLTPGGPNLPAA